MRKALAIQAAQLGETASNDGEPELDADAEILSSCPSSAAMVIILKTLPYAVPATLAEMSKVQKWLKERDLWPATCEQQQRFLRASVAALVGVQELDRKTTYDEMLFIVATFRKTPPSSGKPREDPSSPGDEDVKSKLEIARQNLEQDSSYGQGPSVLQTIAECVVLIVTTLVGISGRSLLNISNASTGYKLATVHKRFRKQFVMFALDDALDRFNADSTKIAGFGVTFVIVHVALVLFDFSDFLPAGSSPFMSLTWAFIGSAVVGLVAVPNLVKVISNLRVLLCLFVGTTPIVNLCNFFPLLVSMYLSANRTSPPLPQRQSLVLHLMKSVTGLVGCCLPFLVGVAQPHQDRDDDQVPNGDRETHRNQRPTFNSGNWLVQFGHVVHTEVNGAERKGCAPSVEDCAAPLLGIIFASIHPPPPFISPMVPTSPIESIPSPKDLHASTIRKKEDIRRFVRGTPGTEQGRLTAVQTIFETFFFEFALPDDHSIGRLKSSDYCHFFESGVVLTRLMNISNPAQTRAHAGCQSGCTSRMHHTVPPQTTINIAAVAGRVVADKAVSVSNAHIDQLRMCARAVGPMCTQRATYSLSNVVGPRAHTMGTAKIIVAVLGSMCGDNSCIPTPVECHEKMAREKAEHAMPSFDSAAVRRH